MRIAIDTNVLHLVMSDPTDRGQALATVLDEYNAEHDLIVSAPVYAELLAAPGAQIATLDATLAGRDVVVDLVRSAGPRL